MSAFQLKEPCGDHWAKIEKPVGIFKVFIYQQCANTVVVVHNLKFKHVISNWITFLEQN